METIEFNGVKFRRYPDSSRRSDRVYFTPGPADRGRGVQRLHQEVWKEANGPIPAGSHIHHKDEDPLNNELGNLELVTPKRHAAAHWTAERSERAREHADVIRPLTKAWHASPEGREWHRQHAHDSILRIKLATHVCDQCGAEYETRPRKSLRFCSNKCRAAARRASGVDDIARTCVICAQTFKINRYSKTKTCSIACGGKSQSATKTTRP